MKMSIAMNCWTQKCIGWCRLDELRYFLAANWFYSWQQSGYSFGHLPHSMSLRRSCSSNLRSKRPCWWIMMDLLGSWYCFCHRKGQANLSTSFHIFPHFFTSLSFLLPFLTSFLTSLSLHLSISLSFSEAHLVRKWRSGQAKGQGPGAVPGLHRGDHIFWGTSTVEVSGTCRLRDRLIESDRLSVFV